GPEALTLTGPPDLTKTLELPLKLMVGDLPMILLPASIRHLAPTFMVILAFLMLWAPAMTSERFPPTVSVLLPPMIFLSPAPTVSRLDAPTIVLLAAPIMVLLPAPIIVLAAAPMVVFLFEPTDWVSLTDTSVCRLLLMVLLWSFWTVVAMSCCP